jgi:hypothetical protein
MATQAKIPIRAARTLQGTPIPRGGFPEKLSQTFIRGALAYIEAASGYLIECAADPTLIMGVANSDGANNAASGVVTQVVDLAHPDTLFRGYLDTSAGEATGVTAQTDLGKGYGVAKSASGGIWYVDKADTTAKRVVIWEFWATDGQAVGDVRHSVLFSFMQAAFQGNIGS